MLKAHGKNGKFFKQCHWCGKEFSTHAVEKHAVRIHFYGKFLCLKCPFKCDFAKDLISHIHEGHKEDQFAKCPSCNKEQSLKDLEVHYIRCVATKFAKICDIMCPICGKTVRRDGLLKHQRIHMREQAKNEQSPSYNEFFHHCDKCDKKFSNRTYLRLHIESEHLNIKLKFKCKHCEIRKSHFSEIKKHERVHQEAKFQCRFCQKKMKTHKALEVHERYHTGEKPYNCSVCKTGFVSSSALGQHKRGAHQITGPRGGKTGWKGSKRMPKE